MTKYYFHIRDSDGLIRDDVGSDFESVSAAHHEAIRLAKCLAEAMKEVGDVVDGQTIEVSSQSGAVFEAVPLSGISAFRTSSYSQSDKGWIAALLGL